MMPDPPDSNEPREKPPGKRSRGRWIWYGVGALLALAILVAVGSFLLVKTRPPEAVYPPTKRGDETAAAPQPTPKESAPEESQQAAPPSDAGGGGGGTTATRPRPLPPREKESRPPRETAAAPSPPPPPPSPVAAEPAPAAIPEFPWPPPRASATVVLPAAFLRSAGAVLHFGDVDHTLTSALDSCGYFDRSYYAVPDGFAIVTRLEQMQADGASKAPPERWALEFKPLERFSLESYLRALFTANPGFYRIIVFVVTSQSFSQSPTGVTRDEALKWLQGGLDRLPAELAGRELTDRYACTALIYQFEQPASGEGAKLDVPSDLPGRIHLERAKLWEALGKPAIGY